MDGRSEGDRPGVGLLVLTNDDGVDAPGLEALRGASQGLGEVRVVAPSRAWSSMGHAVTGGGPIRVDRRGEGRIAVDGSPADCVRLALHHLAPGPSWVLAGINRGGNLGADVHHSGTVAAAREAVLHGVPAIAFSQYVRRDRPLDWDRASRFARRALDLLLARPYRPGTLWNVNLPHPSPEDPDPDLVFCPLDPSPLPLGFSVVGDEATYDGDYHGRARVPGADVETCFGGRVAITRVRILPDPDGAAEDPREVVPMNPRAGGASPAPGR
ncbi:5'/3'-nucleotidase SurE [Tautonia plasticadhaerens]|uniref:5'-nucleotidase SurE n=1 Tax=Tautonia plasticadhaerens TaxID=2527974 RepID=A0A518H5G8_9BACT|nr:5'/3'-nucleotidase SurE [Tautonia plasticadhaerens]QDV36075.1 5'-nucleotidase SurE [Tautonia plasticadhaerens]